MYIDVCVYVYVYIYIYIVRQVVQPKGREGGPRDPQALHSDLRPPLQQGG